MSLAAAAPPVTLTGAGVALFIGSVTQLNGLTEMPMTKTTVKKTAKKTEVTGSTSASAAAGVTQVWQEFSPGPSGGTLESEGHWRVGQGILPPQLRQGAIYYAAAYVWRPGYFGANDPGAPYQGLIFVDDNALVLDPNSGAIDWRLTATFTGAVLDPV